MRPGEIHALLGENGAGKSTLVKMIYGVQHPDEGEIRFDGDAGAHPEPQAARAMGIGMVFQHFSLFEAMTVLENIALGLDERLATPSARARGSARCSPRYGLEARPAPHRRTLSVGERQRIEIVRALLLEPEAPDHGRADQGADAAGGDAVVRDAAQARGRAAARSSTSATSCTRSARSATPRRSCAAARWSAPAMPAQETLALDGRDDDRRQPQGHRKPPREPASAPRASRSTA